MCTTVGCVGIKQIRAITCAEPLHNQQSINRPVFRTNQSIWAPPRGTWTSSRSGRSSVPSPCTTNNPSIGLSAKTINQYGRHRGVRGFQADQGDHLCRDTAQPTVHQSVCHTVPISQYGRHRGLHGLQAGGLQADQGNHLC
jgi:hypothetical protein